ncbi:MAG: hypothetical protein JWM99_4474, partial [Verrucomicrobiales bacterium]|nr:hypothetical protein [Verrucomicrobiales bacterium]
MALVRMISRRPIQIAAGFILSNLFGLGVFKGFQLSISWTTPPGMVLFTSLFIVAPFGMGLITAWFWRHLKLRWTILYPMLLLNSMIAMLWAFAIAREGYICILIISPLLLVLLISGHQFGAFIFGKNSGRLNVSVLAILVAAVWCDSLQNHSFQRSVSDEITINAPSAVVWEHVV